MKLTFSIELTRNKPAPEEEFMREVDMGSQVELAPQPTGFGLPMHEQGPEERRRW